MAVLARVRSRVLQEFLGILKANISATAYQPKFAIDFALQLYDRFGAHRSRSESLDSLGF